MSFKKKNQFSVEETTSPRNDLQKKAELKKVTSFTEVEEKIPELKGFKKDDFAIGKKMGKGQFGEVLLVKHKTTGFICGMKVMEKKQIR